MSGSSWTDELQQDLRFAWRAAWKHPGYSVAAVLTLACGIGAVTTMLSVVNGVILRPLPYPNADRAVLLWTTGRPGTPGPSGNLPLSGPNFQDLRDGASTLEQAAAFRSWPLTFEGSGDTELLAGAKVSAGLFRVLGVQPVLGRTFTADDDVPGAEPVVILGHGIWRTRFGSDPGVLGRSITLDTARYTVVGVMPPGFAFPRGAELPSGFRFPARTELWIPLALPPGELIMRGLQNLAAVALPRPGISRDQVAADLDLVMARIEEQSPGFNTNMTVRPEDLLAGPVEQVGPALYVLLGAVALLLILACANVGNLLLTRSVARQREVAVRGALGASRHRMARQFIAENLVLAGIGGAAGLVLAVILQQAVLAVAPAGLPRMDDIGLDWRIFAFVLALMLLIGLGLGAVSAGQLTAAGAGLEELRDGTRSSGGPGARRFRKGLTTLEVALSVMLLVGAVTLGRTFLALRQVEPGLDPAGVVTARLVQPFKPTSFAEFGRMIPLWARFQASLLDQVRTIPGVREAAVVTSLPLSGAWEGTAFAIEGRPEPTPEQPVTASFAGISPGYFATMGIPILQGRDFSRSDPDSLPGVIVSRSTALAYWPGEDPLGARIRVFGSWLTVIGIAGDVRARDLATEPERTLYLPPSVYTAPSVTLVVAARGDPLGLVPAVREQLRRLDRGTALTSVVTMDEVLAESLAQQRFNALLLGGFSLAALALAVLGLYGVISFGVARRAREFGVRLALGAQPGGVQRMVLREGLMLSLAGVTAGIAGAVALSRVVSRLVYGAAATDPVTLVSVALLLTTVTLLATLLPARRAMRVDPAVVLREE